MTLGKNVDRSELARIVTSAFLLSRWAKAVTVSSYSLVSYLTSIL